MISEGAARRSRTRFLRTHPTPPRQARVGSGATEPPMLAELGASGSPSGFEFSGGSRWEARECPMLFRKGRLRREASAESPARTNGGRPLRGCATSSRVVIGSQGMLAVIGPRHSNRARKAANPASAPANAGRRAQKSPGENSGAERRGACVVIALWRARALSWQRPAWRERGSSRCPMRAWRSSRSCAEFPARRCGERCGPIPPAWRDRRFRG